MSGIVYRVGAKGEFRLVSRARMMWRIGDLGLEFSRKVKNPMLYKKRKAWGTRNRETIMRVCGEVFYVVS